jgi:hypothetical protein
MLFADEVVDAAKMSEIPAIRTKPAKREIDMAERLVASLTSKWDPRKYKDTYERDVRRLIGQKSKGRQVAVEPAPEEPEKVLDLMSALEASLNRRVFDVCTTALLPSWLRRTDCPVGEVDVSGVRALPLASGSNYDRGHIAVSMDARTIASTLWERFHSYRSRPAQHTVVQARSPDGPGVVEVALLERPRGAGALPGERVDHPLHVAGVEVHQRHLLDVRLAHRDDRPRAGRPVAAWPRDRGAPR